MSPSPLQLCVQKLRILIEDSDQNREFLSPCTCSLCGPGAGTVDSAQGRRRWGSRSRTGAGALPPRSPVCVRCRRLRQRFKETSLSRLGRSPCLPVFCTAISVCDSGDGPSHVQLEELQTVGRAPTFLGRWDPGKVPEPRLHCGAPGSSGGMQSGRQRRALPGSPGRGLPGTAEGGKLTVLPTLFPAGLVWPAAGLACAPACSHIDAFRQGFWPVTSPGARTGASVASEGPEHRLRSLSPDLLAAGAAGPVLRRAGQLPVPHTAVAPAGPTLV